MSRATINVTDALQDYLLQVSCREHPAQVALRKATASYEHSRMQISPEQGALMALLVELIGAKRTIEIGVFTGYSALTVALALPADGKVVACDVNREWTDLGRAHWESAGVAHKIDLHLRPASQTLDHLVSQGESGTFDFAFIDADKTGYAGYYERCLSLLRPGGLIAVDNVLWGGAVIDDADQSEDTVAIRELNAALHRDERVSLSVVPIGDGLTLVRKR